GRDRLRIDVDHQVALRLPGEGSLYQVLPAVVAQAEHRAVDLPRHEAEVLADALEDLLHGARFLERGGDLGETHHQVVAVHSFGEPHRIPLRHRPEGLDGWRRGDAVTRHVPPWLQWARRRSIPGDRHPRYRRRRWSARNPRGRP